MNIENKMKEKGYVKVKGAAIVNDVAVTQTSKGLLSATLPNKNTVEIFNEEWYEGWELYRKVNQLGVE